MIMGTRDDMPNMSWQEREGIKYCFDDLADAADEQVDTARDIVDMLRELRIRVENLIGR
jgi:hypothetical protein